MARPDLDDGYLRLAHELFAAVSCAGFNKWETVVLREVFDQIYGPSKSTAAHLSPTDVAGRVGTFKESITRAVRTLVTDGVLARLPTGDVAFVKDYERWQDGGKPRLSPREIAYCGKSKRIKLSNSMGNNQVPKDKPNREDSGTTALPSGTRALPMNESKIVGNNGAPVGNTGAPDPGTTALPFGNTGAPRNGGPPITPLAERALKNGELREKEDSNTYLRPASYSGSPPHAHPPAKKAGYNPWPPTEAAAADDPVLRAELERIKQKSKPIE